MKVALILQEKPASEPSPPPALLKKPRDVFDNLLGVTDDSSAKDGVSKSPVKKKSAQGGVRRCLIIGILEDVPETHYNVHRILQILDIRPQDLDLTFTTDLKLLNILLGMQGHSSSHSCAYCTILTVGPGAYSGENVKTLLKTLAPSQDTY